MDGTIYKRMSKCIKIIENNDFIVDYNKETNTYRVSYFEDNHFKDEICFRGYKELEWKEEAPEKTRPTEMTYTPEELQEEIKKVFEPHHIYTETDITQNISPYCVKCPNHPINGGNGICNCTLGLQPFTYDTPYTTHTTMITDGCAAKGLQKEGEI